jgi:hypothetical protein
MGACWAGRLYKTARTESPPYAKLADKGQMFSAEFIAVTPASVKWLMDQCKVCIRLKAGLGLRPHPAMTAPVQTKKLSTG